MLRALCRRCPQVLADDLDGNGRLDLVLATMNGNIYALETPTEFHPLKAWPAQVCQEKSIAWEWSSIAMVAWMATSLVRRHDWQRLRV